MSHEFDLAIADLGIVPEFNENYFAKFALQRENNSEIIVTLYKDIERGILRMAAHTSNVIPTHISPDFFARFAQAALEPLRGGMGVGVAEGSNHLCVYYSLVMQDYAQGQSFSVLEDLVEQVEAWDAILPAPD